MMWTLTIRSPGGEPRQYNLHSGVNTVGRMSGNEIVILDPSASRYHAQLIIEPQTGALTLQDLGSTNGTFVNRERVTMPRRLSVDDVIRIGQHQIELACVDENHPASATTRLPSSQPLTRDLMLESLDQHAVLLAEVSVRLNTILSLPAALQTVAGMIQVAMAADRCEVILIENLDRLAEMGFARSLAQQAIQQRSAVVIQDAASDPHTGKSAALLHMHAAMCVPVISGDEILGLIYVYKNNPKSRSFEKRDLQLAVAISHQTALTIQRMRLIERVRRQELVSRLLQRFLSPQEAEYLLKEYLSTGALPPVQEQFVTILTVDICESTRLAERVGARRFSRILSHYYQLISQVIFDHNGLLCRYIGDGLMAVFGLPNQPPDPAERAVKAALAVLDRLEQIEVETGEPVRIGVGLNSGQVIAGYLGTDDYVEFTVVGYPVNIAWGLETLARPNRILIGYSTYQALSAGFDIRPLGALLIKPESEPVQVYEVLRSPEKKIAALSDGV